MDEVQELSDCDKVQGSGAMLEVVCAMPEEVAVARQISHGPQAPESDSGKSLKTCPDPKKIPDFDQS